MSAEEETSAQRWARDIDTATLRLSTISVGQVKAAVMGVSDFDERIRLDAALNSFLDTIEADGGPALPFDASHASVWQALMYNPLLAGLPQVDRQVHAQAMHEGLWVVEQRGPATAALQSLGARIAILT